jgi:hypothetical protein
VDAAGACETCGEPLAASAASCEACGALYCPYCRQPMAQGSCEHVLTTNNSGEWAGWPFETLPLPHLAGPPREADWSEQQRREAFARVRPLLAAYSSLWEPPDPARLYGLLRERLSVEIRAATWDNARLGEPGYLTMYFTADPELAQAELSSTIGRLARGFQRLAGLKPDRAG